MALLSRTRILQPLATGHRVVPASLRSSLPIRQHIGRVAAVEQQETSYQPELGVSAVNSPATDVPEKDYRIEELDAAQEELLSWMLFWDGAAQEKDLDEMQDYEELTDQPEFDEAFELEVEDMLEKASETNLRPGQKIHGTVYEVDEDGAYVEIGAKSAGFVPVSECSLAKLKSVSPGRDWAAIVLRGSLQQLLGALGHAAGLAAQQRGPHSSSSGQQQRRMPSEPARSEPATATGWAAPKRVTGSPMPMLVPPLRHPRPPMPDCWLDCCYCCCHARITLLFLLQPLEVLRPGMQRTFVVVEEEDEYGEIILSLAALEVRAAGL